MWVKIKLKTALFQFRKKQSLKNYTLFQKKCNINPSIFPGAPGSVTLTLDLDNFVKFVYTLLQKKDNFRNVAFLLEKRVFHLKSPWGRNGRFSGPPPTLLFFLVLQSWTKLDTEFLLTTTLQFCLLTTCHSFFLFSVSILPPP